jgi:predicted MPP superfamily phosphohydrolase
MRARFVVFIAIFQSVLFLAHAFLYQTWDFFWRAPDPPGISTLQLTLAILSVSFLAASLLAFRYHNFLVRWFYTASAVWLGTMSYLFLAACSCWAIYGFLHLAGVDVDGRMLAALLFGAALTVSAFGVVNAAWTRVRRISVKLPNLPASWRGRVAALVSDLHLGHVRNVGFTRRIVTMLRQLRPDVVFIAGDLYDGTAADVPRLAGPLAALSAPLGAFFVAGNHEEFRDHTKYLEAVERTGVRVLNNEKVELDGLQLVGVHYRQATNAQQFGKVLRNTGVDRERASILLTHAPHLLNVAEEAGIALQLSGHTHRGQYFPFTWITRRIYRDFVYGLQRLGKMQIYTSCGAGTWGPPLRVGSSPEIVLIRFE